MNNDRNPAMPELSKLRLRQGARGGRRPRRIAWLAVLLLLLLFLMGGTGLYLFRERIFESTFIIETATVVRSGVGVRLPVLTANGYVTSRKQAGVTPKVSGRIKVLRKDLGDKVKQGEVLAELEDADLQAALDEAKATLWVSEITAERDRKLLQEQVGSQADYDLSLARAKEAAARVKNYEEQIENTRVRAPFEGLIIVKNGEVGETVSLFGAQTSRKSGPIFVIADFREFEVEADVNESNIAKIQPGQEAEIVLDAVPDRSYKGRLRQIVPTADRQKATIQVKVSLLAPDERVYPEMSAKVTFLEGGQPSGKERVLAPAAGIVDRGGRRVAFVLSGDRVKEVPVEAGPAEGGRFPIEEGLSGGESIVIFPPPTLSDGSRVRLKGGG